MEVVYPIPIPIYRLQNITNKRQSSILILHLAIFSFSPTATCDVGVSPSRDNRFLIRTLSDGNELKSQRSHPIRSLHTPTTTVVISKWMKQVMIWDKRRNLFYSFLFFLFIYFLSHQFSLLFILVNLCKYSLMLMLLLVVSCPPYLCCIHFHFSLLIFKN